MIIEAIYRYIESYTGGANMGLFDKIFNRSENKRSGASESEIKAAKELQLIIQMAAVHAEKMRPERRRAIFDGQRPDDDNFGYSCDNPICTGGFEDSEDYLSRLRTLSGEKLDWLRSGSINLKKLHGIEAVDVDTYNLYLDGKLFKEIHICPYAYNSSNVPKGLILSPEQDNREFGGNIAKEARESGMSPEQFLHFKELQVQNQQEVKMKKENAQRERMERLQEKAIHVKKKYSNFDLLVELQDDLFATLADSNIDMTTLYEYIHKGELFVKAKNSLDTSGQNSPTNYEECYSILRGYEEFEPETSPDSLSSGDIIQQAKENGMAPAMYQIYLQLRYENAVQSNSSKDARLKELSNQAIATKQAYCNFDLKTEMNSSLFRSLIYLCNMMVAYELVHFKELFVRRDSATQNNQSESVLFCRTCGEKLVSGSLFCHKCGTKIANNEHENRDSYSSIFEKRFDNIMHIIQCSELVKNPQQELLPAMFVITDYAAASSHKYRKKVADDIVAWIKTQGFGKYWNETSLSFDERVGFYGEIIRGRKLRGEWLEADAENFAENPILRCVVALGDNLYNPNCVNDYDNAPIMLYNIMDTIFFASKIMTNISSEITGLFKDIYDYKDTV